VKGLNPNDKIEDLYIESPPFWKDRRRITAATGSLSSEASLAAAARDRSLLAALAALLRVRATMQVEQKS
jgi:hypothetical protein